MVIGIAEILQKTSTLPKEQKVSFLQQNASDPLKAILQYALDPRIKWVLPSGKPPYKPNELVDQQGRLYNEIRKLQYFVDLPGSPSNLHPIKRERMFIEFIEGLAPEDAELMCHVKDKKIPYKAINAKLINSAFPGLIKEE